MQRAKKRRSIKHDINGKQIYSTFNTNTNVKYKQYNSRIQNKNGNINDSYNYSTKQYLTKRNENQNNECTIYKFNNGKFSQQGAVSGGSRINRLKYNTVARSQQACKPKMYKHGNCGSFVPGQHREKVAFRNSVF